MFEFSGFDPATMSDDELLQKTTDLHAKLVFAGRFGSADMIGSLQRLLQVIENERAQRVMRLFARDRDNAISDVIESDPDLAAAERDQESPERGGKIVPQKKPRPLISISQRPTSD
ncbi:MAG: hypothetical protein EOO77_26320 [Oxalobacteraceae bacterium]|nr:MAG: hypothetical protein EOO77_26320 [Oxalobacteraceae bacterium]